MNCGGLDVHHVGLVTFGGKTLNWRRDRHKIELIKRLGLGGPATAVELGVAIHHINVEEVSARMGDSVRASITKLVSRTRSELAENFGGEWLVFASGKYHLRMEDPAMVSVGGTLGDISQTDRAVKEELPVAALPPLQRKAWMDVEAFRRANPEVNIKSACNAVGVGVHNYYLAKRKMEQATGFSEADKIRPDSPIVKNLERQERAELAKDTSDEGQAWATDRCGICLLMECSAAKDPDLPCDAGSVTKPILEDEVRDQRVYPAFDRSKHVLDPNEILRDQLEYGRKQLDQEEVGEDVEPVTASELLEDEPEAEAEPVIDPDQVLHEVLAWLRPLDVIAQKRVVVAAQVMLGIL